MRADLFELTQDFPTPFVVCDLEEIERNTDRILAAFPGVRPFYAIKCNPHPRIIERLQAKACGFEIASPAELDLVLRAGGDPEAMACCHTIKTPAFLEKLEHAGVRLIAADSSDEVRKIAQFAPGARLMIRLHTGTTKSRLLLSGKFGAPAPLALELFQLARKCGLETAGITIHAGSQCENLEDWELAIEECFRFRRELENSGTRLHVMSFGGGLPVTYTASVPSLDSIGAIVDRFIERERDNSTIQYMTEPGRAIAASAGTMIATVIGTAERDGFPWVYLDAGVYHGLFEKLKVAGGFVLPVRCQFPDRPQKKCCLAGPTCDSIDTLPGTYDLPELRTGDRIAFGIAGAYSTSLVTTFNGFAPPSTIFLQDLL